MKLYAWAYKVTKESQDLILLSQDGLVVKSTRRMGGLGHLTKEVGLYECKLLSGLS